MTTHPAPLRACDRTLVLPGALASDRWKWLVATFFYVPFGRRPGVIAYVVAVLRATILSYGIGFLAMAVAGRWMTVHDAIARFGVVFVFVVCEEASRLGFVWRADDRRRAVWFFFGAITLVETISFGVAAPHGASVLGIVLARSPSILLHGVISLALLRGLSGRRTLWVAELAIITAHTVFNFYIPVWLAWASQAGPA